MITLTPIEWNVLTYIQNYMRRWSIPPRMRDIKHGCAIAGMRQAHETLCELEALGLIERQFGKARHIKLVKDIGPVAVSYE